MNQDIELQNPWEASERVHQSGIQVFGSTQSSWPQSFPAGISTAGSWIPQSSCLSGQCMSEGCFTCCRSPHSSSYVSKYGSYVQKKVFVVTSGFSYPSTHLKELKTDGLKSLLLIPFYLKLSFNLKLCSAEIHLKKTNTFFWYSIDALKFTAAHISSFLQQDRWIFPLPIWSR